MSGRFGNLGGFIEIMFNSRGGNSYMPGGGCCNNNFGNIWGGNCGTMMPFANTYNPFCFNNLGYSNFGSIYMPTLGGCNPYGGSQFGGYGEFNNYGSEFGAYAQFGGSDYGYGRSNNGFGKLLGYLGVGFLGYGVGQSEGQTFGDKFSNFINTLLGNKAKKDSADKTIEQEPKINLDGDKNKDANADVNTTEKTQTKAQTEAKAEAATEKTKKTDNNTDNAPKGKSGEAEQSDTDTKTKTSKITAETEEEKKLKADAQLQAKILILADREKTLNAINNNAKVPITAYDKFNITNKRAYEPHDTVTTIENSDGSSVTYFDEDGEKKTGFKNGWDRIVRLAKDGSGTIEAKGLDISNKENSTITKKYDADKNLLEETVKYNKTGIVEVYSKPNKNNSFKIKTVTNPNGKKAVYVLNKNENLWIKQKNN